ncbi:hypothetical protein [Marinisporobacter balticus]|uniref:Uncharacterized protein n=1 Tax=Marinisporobacter balticus TaxID=2018667 RepID=A0A4R2L0W9_9FIRM|nr:hypothetical protein [Marinisporobacter balticus]TCO80074.1 hypothetical protein EV214_101312 [Marinisporobacter balticus]
MDKVQKIYSEMIGFIQVFIIKYEYEHRGILKKMKIDSRLNMEIDDEKWCQLFLYKSCFNHCAQFILLRYIEDSGLSYMRMNKKGIEKWRSFVKNIYDALNILYDLAIKDLQQDHNDKIRTLFKESDYDVFKIDDELAKLLCEKLSNIDFSSLKKSEMMALFQLIYSLEQREDMRLHAFYKDAYALSYILDLENRQGVL